MGLAEIVLAGLCLNSTLNCTNDTDYHYDTQLAKYKRGLLESLKNEHFVITTLKNGPLSGYENTNGTLIGTGVAFDIIKILQREYQFKYKLVTPDDDTFEAPDGTTGGVKNMLLKRRVDIAAAFLPMKFTNEFKYSKSLASAQWVVLMRRPKESATGSGLMAPFTATVWTLIIISLFTVGPILYLVMLLRGKICEETGEMVFSLPACMWFVYGALLKQGSTLNPTTDSSRILFSTWWIFITILTAFYTANLTAFLTLSKFTLPINVPEDIGKKQYKWLTNKGNGIIEELRNSREYKSNDGKSLYEQIGLPKRQVNDDDNLILSDFVSKQNFMYIREKIVLETTMYEDYKQKTRANIEEAKRCTFVITNFPICTFKTAFAYRPGFKYAKLFDSTLQHIVESGITEFKQREFLPDTKICPLDLGNKERRLRNTDLSMTYMIVGGGLIISTIVFIVELFIYYYYLKIRKGYFQKKRSLNLRQNGLTGKVTFNKKTTDYNLFEPIKHFITPPPPYHTLFGPPPGVPGIDYTKKMINGRNYWVINDKNGMKTLIPQRTPSALLFQFTN